MKVGPLISLLAVGGLATSQLPMLCHSSPPIHLDAGISVVSARIDNPLALRCTASLVFSDLDFLPVSYAFESARCKGLELASFLVPLGAPDGDAYIIWQCAGQSPTCSRATVSGGRANTSLELQQAGNVSCIVQSLATSTSLVTLPGTATTVVETLLSVFTSATTIQVAPSPTFSVSLSSAWSVFNNASMSKSSPSSTSILIASNPLSTQFNNFTFIPSSMAASTTTVADSRQASVLTSAGSAVIPSVVAVTMFSTITVMQSMTSFISACSSDI